MSLKIALAGNPNSGKTTLFNSLTGSNQYVGNWPGVTVEKKEGKLKKHDDVTIVDLPGIYSLSPYTLEEVVARNFLIDERPDAILNIVDGTNLERNLYITTQLVELGIPVVVAINMIDIVRKNGDEIYIDELSKQLGCRVVGISALKNENILAAAEAAIEAAKKGNTAPKPTFSGSVEHALAHIEEAVLHDMPKEQQRWFAIKIFERDEKVLERLNIPQDKRNHIEEDIVAVEEEMDDDAESIITNERYIYISKIIKTCYKKKNQGKLTTSDKIDKVVTNRFLALPIFAAVMFLVYYISISTIGTIGTDWVNETLFGEIVPNALGGFLEGLGIADWLYSLIMDGIVAGVGAVLGFLPQMVVLFICLAVLEDCGYMARIAFVLDKIFRRFGLSGKSFIPMLISTGCGVPGIMASRTIESDNERRMTIMTSTFMPCSAKLPIIALIAGAFFKGQSWVAPSTYFLGIASIVVSGIMLKKTKFSAGNPSPFVLELPPYHAPSIKNVARSVYERSKSFVKKASSVILLSTILIWFLQGFNWQFQMVENAENSILASIGSAIAPIFAPLGFGDWRASVASLSGLLAKENLVGTLGVLYGFGEASEGAEFWSMLSQNYSAQAGYALMAFNLLCVPCMAAVAALRREMMSGKNTMFALLYQTIWAYIVSLMIYQFGTFIKTGVFGVGTIAAIIAALAVLYMLFIKKPYTPENNIKKKGLAWQH